MDLTKFRTNLKKKKSIDKDPFFIYRPQTDTEENIDAPRDSNHTNNTINIKTKIPAQLFLSSRTYHSIINHANRNSQLECGGYLIGNLAQDRITGAWIGTIDDVFNDDSIGEPSTYTFSPRMTLSALNYCKEHYQDDWDLTKHIIGNYHSHGLHEAFFSETDQKMMHAQATDEFYLVYSPKHETFVAIFMDSDFCPHNVKISYFDEKRDIPNGFTLGENKGSLERRYRQR